MKLANQELLNEIALKQQKRQKDQETFEITESELEFLYEKANEELDIMLNKTKQYKNDLKNFFYGEVIFEEALSSMFFDTINKLISKMLPAILTGDYDILNDELMWELTEKDLDKLRSELYNFLKKRYL